jgi:TrmH family RNA methyltransferase
MKAARQVASAANPLVKHLRRLAQEPGAYRKLGQLWLEGDHLVRAFLARGGRARLAVLPDAPHAAWVDPQLRALALQAEEVVLLAPALWAGCSSLESPASIGFLVDLPQVQGGRPQRVDSVLLDRLQDPGNVGSILRSAAALGVRQVLALKGTVALWSPKVLRAGMGAHFGLQLHEGLTLSELDGLELPLVGTSSYAQAQLDTAALPQPCAWVLGHEGQGVSAALQARCTLNVCIPQPGGEESLNVAAAAAVCFYEALRQRRARQ